MSKPSFRTHAFLACALALLMTACAGQLEPASQAIAGIEKAIAAAPDAGKYVPDQLAAVQAQLAELKTAFDGKDYQAVLNRAPGVLKAAQDLLGDAMLKRDAVVKQMSTEWPALAASLPGLVAKVPERAAAIAKHPPAGVDLAAAQGAAAGAAELWSKAQAAFKSSDVESAVTSAREARAKVEAAAAAMKMKLPAAPGAAPAK